ncbi:MAG: hypothetical protein EOO77_33560 [Oxalobacteraceae bacterium]|nr:MAG: hypothetical protein EOO77_33560 [Oxalobacteraceae bacterium]
MIEIPTILELPPDHGTMHVERKLREITMLWEMSKCENLISKAEDIRPLVCAFAAKHLPHEIVLKRTDPLGTEQISAFTPWLNENCQGYWTIVWTLTWDDMDSMTIRFTDSRDAVLFRVMAT